MRKRGAGKFVALIAMLVAVTAVGLAQRGRGGPRIAGGEDFERVAEPHEGEFHFIRLEYSDGPNSRRGFGFSSRDGQGAGWWMMDWPAAENHFTAGVQRLTRIECGDPRHVGLRDDRIYDYPFIYATQVGWWNLSDVETARLREFLLRGGYLMTDDFWSTDNVQWPVFEATMARVLPGQPITDLTPDDPVRHVVYDIQDKDLTWIPGSRHLRGGEIVQPYGTQPAWLSIEDGKGHTVVAVNYNTDIGDAWEFADVPYYPEKMTALAYRYGINYVVYAMTH